MITKNVPKRIVLNNGLRAILYHVANSNSIAIQLRGKAGSNYEKSNNIGSAHFVEHVLCKLTQEDATNKRFFYNGGKLVGITSRDDVIYALRFLCADMAHAINLLFKLFTYDISNLVDSSDLQQQKDIIKNEIARYKSNPEKLIGRNIYKILFPKNRISILNSGEAVHVDRLDKQLITEFKNRLYIPKNFVIVICGNVQKNKLLRLLDSSFATLKPGVKPANVVLKPDTSKNYQRVTLDHPQPSYIKINFYGYKISDDKKYAAVVFIKYLDTHLKSLFSLKSQAKNTVNCSSFSTASYGFLDIYIVCHCESVKKTIDTVLSEINNFSSYVDKNHLKGCINSIISNFYFEFEKASVVADYYAELLLHGREEQNHVYEIEKIKNITIEDILSLLRDLKKQKPKITVFSG